MRHKVSITGNVRNTGPTATGSSGNNQGGMMNKPPAGTILLKNFKHISTSCNPS
jgi:hypothetical protein